MLSQEFLDILACPDCKAEVFLDGEALQCVNAECRRRYAVRDGIPVLLIDESEILEPSAFEQALARRKTPRA